MDSKALTLRPATVGELDFLVDLIVKTNIERYGWHEKWEEVAFRAAVRDRSMDEVQGRVANSTTYVIEVAGERAGRLRVVRQAEAMLIGGIQVRPKYQGRGLGTAIIEAVIHEANHRGLPVLLDVEKDNPRARRLYDRLGFVVIDEDDDRIWMKRRQD